MESHAIEFCAVRLHKTIREIAAQILHYFTTHQHNDMKTSLWFSWLILLIAAAALCLSWFRCEPIEADWAAILVGVLAILVTALIGWQVYNVVDLKTTRYKLDGAIKASTDLNAELNNFKIYVDAEAYCNNADNLYILKRYIDAIEQCIRALQMYASIENYEQKGDDIKLGIHVCIANWAVCLIDGNGRSSTDYLSKEDNLEYDKKSYKTIMNYLDQARPIYQSAITANDDIKDLLDIMKTIDPNTSNNLLSSELKEKITKIHRRNNTIVENFSEKMK